MPNYSKHRRSSILREEKCQADGIRFQPKSQSQAPNKN